MSMINITKEDDGLTRVRVIQPIRGYEHSETVELNGVHPHLKMYLKCTYKMISGSLNRDFQFNVWLALTLEEKFGEQTQEITRPCAIWGNVNAMNGGEKIQLNQLSTNQWNSEPFLVQFVRNERRIPVEESSLLRSRNTLNYLIWIKFETIKVDSFTSGERNLLQQFAELFVRQSNCDVQFIFEDNQEIGGHIVILSARSPVFAAMFQHNMTENQRRQVDIRDVKSVVFKQLLHYIYSGRLGTPLCEEDAQPLYVAADKYDIGDLKEECVRFLLSHIRVDNTVHLLAWAHLHSVDKIQEAALDFAALHGNEICMLDDWTNLAKNYPDLCVSATRRMMANMSVHNKPLQEEDTICSRLEIARRTGQQWGNIFLPP